MAEYRFYCLDSTGRLYGAEWFHAENDADAISLIETKHPRDTCEIWQGKRLVAKISPQPQSPQPEIIRQRDFAEPAKAASVA